MANYSDCANSVNFHTALRCTKSKYAYDFFYKGSVKFNMPMYWETFSVKDCKGRGDTLEGTFARYHKNDIVKGNELNDKYKNCHGLIRKTYGESIYLKNNRSMELPCYCLYIIKDSDFKPSYKEGKHKLCTDIPEAYFEDFKDKLPLKEDGKKCGDDEPALVIIYKFNEFKCQLLKSLSSIGLEESEIIFSVVAYVDFEKYGNEGYWDFGNDFPNELTIKHKQFENQSEVRIIINTDKNDVKEFLENNPIEIGSMKGIAEVYKGDLHGGIHVEMTNKACASKSESTSTKSNPRPHH